MEDLSQEERSLITTAIRLYRKKTERQISGLFKKYGLEANVTDQMKRLELLLVIEKKLKAID